MQEATEVTLETEVEAGASGYSVTGGGDQGIFVTQVLKDSSAAKLFSLREGAWPPTPGPKVPSGWGTGGGTGPCWTLEDALRRFSLVQWGRSLSWVLSPGSRGPEGGQGLGAWAGPLLCHPPRSTSREHL